MARIREAQGDLDGALALLDEAERRYTGDYSPNARPVAALTARLWVKQGRLDEALAWARERGLAVEDDPSYLREFEHLTLARLLLARITSERADRPMLEAMSLLARLLHAAEAGGRTGSIIEVLVLRALAYQMHGDLPAAVAPLERALALAEPEGYVRLFVDEGPPMAALLRDAAARGVLPAYTGKLLAACDAEHGRSPGASPHPVSPASGPVTTSQSLIEPLSQRELEVLRLFDTALSGPEIADALAIGLSTVRTHTKRIYSKLAVTNRRAAVTRAAELGLI
jgi:LuxR family maltose regulon positive regulatory protein